MNQQQSRDMRIQDLQDPMNDPTYLRARLSELEGRRVQTPNITRNVRDDMLPQSGRTTRSYHESANPLALSSGKEAHYSGKFLIPKETEGCSLTTSTSLFCCN